MEQKTYDVSLTYNELMRLDGQVGKKVQATIDKARGGHHKGDIRHDKPLYYPGVVYNATNFIVQGHADLCRDCDDRWQVTSTLVHYIRDHRLPIEIRIPGFDTLLFRDVQYECFRCHQLMWESDMTWKNSISSRTPKGCPHCGAFEVPIVGDFHRLTHDFRMVPENHVQKPLSTH